MAITAIAVFVLAVAAFGQLNVSNPFYPTGFFRGAAVGCTMQITGMGQTNTTTAASSYTLARSNTPPANRLMLVSVVNSKATTPDIPTLTGLGVLWVNIGTTNWGGGLYRLTLFRSLTNNTPTSDAIVADFAGANQTGCNMRGVYFDDVNLTGNQGAGAIVQVVQTTNSTANPVITLAALGGSTNSVYACFANDVNGYNATSIDSGWTQDIQNGYNSPATGQLNIFAIDTADNTPSITDGAQAWAGIAVEILKACP